MADIKLDEPSKPKVEVVVEEPSKTTVEPTLSQAPIIIMDDELMKGLNGKLRCFACLMCCFRCCCCCCVRG